MNSKIEGLAKEREDLNQKINELQERHKTLELARENSNSSAIAKELKDIEPKLEEFKKELVKKDQKLLDAEITLNDLLLENKKLSEKINEILDARSDDLLSAKGQEIKLKEQILRLENELKQLKK